MLLWVRFYIRVSYDKVGMNIIFFPQLLWWGLLHTELGCMLTKKVLDSPFLSLAFIYICMFCTPSVFISWFFSHYSLFISKVIFCQGYKNLSSFASCFSQSHWHSCLILLLYWILNPFSFQCWNSCMVLCIYSTFKTYIFCNVCISVRISHWLKCFCVHFSNICPSVTYIFQM